MLCWLNLMFNSNQGLLLFRQTQILTSTRHKQLTETKQSGYFIQLLNPCLHFTINKFTIPEHIEEILEQPILLNPHTKLSFSSNNPYFYSIPTKNITGKLTIIRDLCQFLQTVLISYLRFKRNWIIVPNDWKWKIKKKNFSKIPLQDSALTAVVLGR